MIEVDKYLQQKQKEAQAKNIVFFDGVCNLCNGSVDFIIKRDKNHYLHFASLQSDFAKYFLKEFNYDSTEMKTVYFYEKGKLYHKSEAVFRMLIHLNQPYRLLGKILLVLPSFLPNLFYNLIARVRYKILGKRSVCRLPTKAEEKMFLG